MTATTRHDECNSGPTPLLMALELGRYQWSVGFTTGVGQRPRRRVLRSEHWARLTDEMAAAKRRLGLRTDAPVMSCYEAGPDGFWVHRCLTTLGVVNVVVDAASIEINRRARRAKTDRLDVDRLLAQLVRYVGGERTAFRVVRVPTEADEHRRHLHRELRALITDRRRVTNRIGGLLATQGICMKVRMDFRRQLPALRQWNGHALAETFQSRLEREWAKVELYSTQIVALERERTQLLRQSSDPAVALVHRLLELRGLGEASAWLFVMELFAWRQFSNRRQVGAVTGLVPTPYKSGTLAREQGISKAGNRQVRRVLIQIAWGWLRYQPQSALSRWFHERFGHGRGRMRRVGIVALARRLFIALWRFVAGGLVPEGARLRAA